LGPDRRWLVQAPPKDNRQVRYSYDTNSVTTKDVARICCGLRRDPGAIIEVAKGTQLQVAYGDKRPENIALAPAFGSHAGVVKSGSEWVLVRTDGVVLVDARVTIAFATDILMDMTIKATIDLNQTFKMTDGYAAYRAYRDGLTIPALVDAKGRYYHNITGSVRFEGGTGPVDSDYADHFRKSASKFDAQLALLVRQQFNVAGKVYITKTPHYDPTEIEVRVLSW
jgi:hypothetical protein